MTRRMWVARVAAGLLLAGVLGMPAPARADDEDTTPALTVYVIEASNGPGGVDEEIAEIRKRAGDALPFKTWRLISKLPARVPLGSEKKLLVPDNRQVVLRPTQIVDDHLSVDVEIRKKGERPTRVSGRLANGGTFIVGGYPHGDGRLVFAISATF